MNKNGESGEETTVRLREKKLLPTTTTATTTNMTDINSSPSTVQNGNMTSTTTMNSSSSTQSTTATFENAFFFGLTIDDALNSSENLIELFYNACKYNHFDLVKKCVEDKNVNVNEPYNNDYPLCIASHKGHYDIVKYLLEHNADVHLKRELNLMTTRGNHRLSRANLHYGDSPLSLSVKYGFEDIAILLVEHGSDILNENYDFEKSPLQDAIRLNRNKVLIKLIEKLKITTPSESNENLLLQKKGDILRQCLINDQIEALKVFVPNVWEELNGDFIFAVLNNLMLKNKIQSDKAFDVLEAILEAIPSIKLKMYDIGDLLKRFLHVLQAQFLTINDDRIQILYLRTSLLFTILKYHDTVDFSQYLDLLDSYFRAIFSSVENTGEGINQIYEYIIRFYENLILMGHLILTNNDVILKLLECPHVTQMQPADMYLSWRARNPFLLKERCRLIIKNNLKSFKRSSIEKLKLNDETFLYMYYQR
ncbi:unnamed protein product [Didymodactylos carnosus]|uniref:Ankyrin repeat-containing protein n=1 Tax=Didymodactylos carnosus TaxID=1234261 RepID=A0A813PZ83_9BILA|nr:unnamed protein product [Didymodactylos carnosus]CAF1106783.1 unnamed protein product [Didymodactylos carnosus]CAF3541919.1 unnamed protein product [Didymodactylos carnosus]CAF3870862.1 unnamed protein product [Didymodactylos carnosus]